MPSARSIALIVPLAALALSSAGCVTTQRLAERQRLLDARILDSQHGLRVTHLNNAVRVTRIEIVEAGRGSAIVASLRNVAARPQTDLPISVGVLAPGGAKQYLNRAAGTAYDENHVVALPPRGEVSWVFTTARRLPRGARPFADVGVARLPASTAAAELPQIAADARAAGNGLLVSVANRSGVPQQQLPVYAIASRAGRYIAAARGELARLGGGARSTLVLDLPGARGSTVQVEALPTIFR